MDDNPIQLVLYEEDSGVQGHEKIFVDVVGEEFLLFKTEYVDILWDKYRIVADSIDEDLNEYGSKHLPSVLQPEQVQVLVECGFVRVRRIVNFSAFNTPIKPKDTLSEEEVEQLRDRAARVVCGQVIKDRKRKALVSEEISPKKLKMTYAEVDEGLKTIALDEKEVDKAFNMLVSRTSQDLRRFVNLEHEAPPDFYEYLELHQIPFPTTEEYRIKLTTFRDLWRKGFFMTSGIKFGCHYLAYDASPTRVHSKYMVFCHSASEPLMPYELTGLSRVASQVKKNVLVSVVTNDTLSPYNLEVSWWKGHK